MNPLIDQSKNPLSNGKVVGVSMDPARYAATQDAPRGSIGFVMSRSELCSFAKCPERWVQGVEDEETKSTEWGTLIDGLLLDGEKFKDRFAVEPETYHSSGMKCPQCGSITESKSCRKCGTDRVSVIIEKPWDRKTTVAELWKEDQGNKAIVRHKDHVEANAAIARLLDDPSIRHLVECSAHQVMVLSEYHDAETGLVIPIKTLIDGVPDKEDPDFGKCLWDLKTAVAADEWSWKWAVDKHGYHVQAAMELDAYVAATGEDRCDFRHIVQENFKPYQPARWALSSEFIELGRLLYLQMLKRYCQCLHTSTFPGYQASGNSFQGWGFIEPEAKMAERVV